MGVQGLSRQGHTGLPQLVLGPRRRLPALTPWPLARTSTGPPPDGGQHHCPCALDPETGLATGGRGAGAQGIQPCSRVGKAQGREAGTHGQGAPSCRWPPAPRSHTRGSGARKSDGWSAWVGVTLGTLASATHWHRMTPGQAGGDAVPLRHDLQASWPEAPERVDTPRPGSPDQDPRDRCAARARGPEDTPGPLCVPV